MINEQLRDFMTTMILQFYYYTFHNYPAGRLTVEMGNPLKGGSKTSRYVVGFAFNLKKKSNSIQSS